MASFYFIILFSKFPVVNEEGKLFPINYMRNLAFKNVRSDLVMYIEGDYVVSKRFRKNLMNRM